MLLSMWQHCPGGELLRQPPPWADARLVASKRAANAVVIGFIPPPKIASTKPRPGGRRNTSADPWYMSRREGPAVISAYFEERSLTDGGEELIALAAKQCRTGTISLWLAKETRC